MEWTRVGHGEMSAHLARFSTVDHLFYEPDLLSLWISHFASGPDVSLVVGRDADTRTACALPLLRRPLLGGSVRQITTLFGPEMMRSPFYATPPGTFTLSSVVDHLMEDERGWDVLKCIYMPSPILDACESRCVERGYPFLRLGSAYSRFLTIEGTFEDYLQSTVRKKSSREVRRLERKLSESGRLRLEVLTDEDDVRRGLASAYEVSEKTWTSERNTHIGGETVLGRFYRDLFDLYVSRQMLSVYLLSYDERAVAFMIAVRHGRTVYLLKTGYDLSLERYSIGSIVWYHVLQHIFDAGSIDCLDFLSDYDYLRLWSRQRREYGSLAIFHRGIRGRAIGLAASTAWRLRHSKTAVGEESADAP